MEPGAVREQVGAGARPRKAVLRILHAGAHQRLLEPLDDAGRPGDDPDPDGGLDSVLFGGAALKALDTGSDCGDFRFHRRWIRAQHLAGDTLRRRVPDLVLEALGAGAGPDSGDRAVAGESVCHARTNAERVPAARRYR